MQPRRHRRKSSATTTFYTADDFSSSDDEAPNKRNKTAPAIATSSSLSADRRRVNATSVRIKPPSSLGMVTESGVGAMRLDSESDGSSSDDENNDKDDNKNDSEGDGNSSFEGLVTSACVLEASPPPVSEPKRYGWALGMNT
ncbi:hypothetical protein MPER_12064 [Moniliophthora perniciosa FA553]|nr:hypothetical protein MPER_12064 [Moniliophthora perniciosa FA553]